MARLALSNEEFNSIHKMVSGNFDCIPGADDLNLRQAIYRAGPEYSRDLACACLLESGNQADPAFLDRVARTASLNIYKPQDLTIGGDDLKNLGVSPGPAMGKILQTLVEKVVADPDCNKPETLLQMASSMQEKMK